MTRELNNKKISKSATKKMENKTPSKKRDESSDDESLYTSDSESDEMDEQVNEHEYRKFLQKIFPSKHLSQKIKTGEELKNTLRQEINKKSKNVKPVASGSTKKDKKDKKEVIVEEESESDEEPEYETCEESEEEEKEFVKKTKKQDKKKKNRKEEEEDESEEEETPSKKDSKINIIFTIGDAEYKDEYDDYDSEEDDDYDPDEETEDEDEDVSTSSSEEPDSEEEAPIKKKMSKKKSDIKNTDDGKNILIDKEIVIGTTNNIEGDTQIMSQLKELYEKNKGNSLLQKCIDICEKDVETQNVKNNKKSKKQKEKNTRIYKKIVKDKNTMNDSAFFEKLEIDVQKKIIKELKEINKIIRIEKPYRLTLLESNMPTLFKSAAMKKINSLRYMEPGSGEYYKIKNWVSSFMSIPFGEYKTLPISITDGVDKCHEFMETSQKILNDAVYGLNDAKMQIMQMLGQLVTNPKSIGSAIAIHGPPGTGKTSLVKEGISKILGRPFAFIALGGATDSSFLEGHGYTYEGSTWGKIVQILIDSKCMNPVIYFDELDKISDTPKGEEIAGILTHLTDTSQNSQFHDKYFAEIDFDLSKCLFIFSYNDESKVNPILKDRMYRIQTKGYNQKQKSIISNQYLLPKIREQVRFDETEIIIPPETINYIVDNLCNKEDGVRNLKRCLEIIYTKLNLYRLMKPGSNLFEEDMALKVEFPFTVTKDIVDKLIKKNTENINAMYSLYV